MLQIGRDARETIDEPCTALSRTAKGIEKVASLMVASPLSAAHATYTGGTRVRETGKKKGQQPGFLRRSTPLEDGPCHYDGVHAERDNVRRWEVVAKVLRWSR